MATKISDVHNETLAALQIIQKFDASSLGRRDVLGEMNFEEVIPSAERLVRLFQRVPQEILRELPDEQLHQIINAINSTRKLFDDVQAFDLKTQSNPNEARNNLVGQIESHYSSVFARLHHWISYGVARTVDFNGLDAEARAVVKGVQDRADAMEATFSDRERKLDELEQQLRATLAEQGVSQQAVYFASEATLHEGEAKKWGEYTFFWALVVIAGTFASLFTHRIGWLAPINVAEAIQFIASKILLIGALTFMLVRSARNYSAHKHNQVINKHKQNSLLTFNALVEAGSGPEARDAVLNHASAAIYETPESGYVRAHHDRASSNTTLVELLPRMTRQLSDPSA